MRRTPEASAPQSACLEQTSTQRGPPSGQPVFPEVAQSSAALTSTVAGSASYLITALRSRYRAFLLHVLGLGDRVVAVFSFRLL